MTRARAAGPRPLVGLVRELPRGDGLLDPEHFGVAAHEVIQGLARLVGCEADIQAVVKRAMRRRGTQSPALRRRLVLCARVWCGRFAPPASCVLRGSEVPLGPVRLDLLWQWGEYLWADELKTGEPNSRAMRQAERQALLGDERFGSRFLGVRLVWLEHPGASLALRVPRQGAQDEA